MPQGSSAVKPTNGLYLYLLQQTNIHASGGIRTHNLSRRAAEDVRLRPRGHWDRRYGSYTGTNLEGNSRGPIEVLKRYLFGGAEENYENQASR